LRSVSTGLIKKRVNIIMEEINRDKGHNGKNRKNGNHAAEREPILHIRDLRKTYMQGKIPVQALDWVNFDVNKGELLSKLFGGGKKI
jgi:ABC-type glutathione transport system ATPase component